MLSCQIPVGEVSRGGQAWIQQPMRPPAPDPSEAIAQKQISVRNFNQEWAAPRANG